MAGAGPRAARRGCPGSPPPPALLHVVYLCSANGWSLHNVGRALVAPMAARGVRVEVVDDPAWHAAPGPCDVLVFAHRDHYLAAFPYRDHAAALAVVVHDPDEVSTFYDRLDWRRWPLHPRPELAAFDRVLTCSAEMVEVLTSRYGLRPWFAPTMPHNADAAAEAGRAARRSPARGPVRFLSTAYGAEPVPWPRVLGRVLEPGRWLRDERGRPSVRQARSALVRRHRKNVPWLRRLESALADVPGAETDFQFGRRLVQLPEADYLARVAGGDVYVCTSTMEGGPLPVMEAVLAGLAVVTTPVGQTAEWVRDGVNGAVCRTYAEVERAARRYAADPDRLRAHQAASLDVAATQAFDADAWAAFLTGTRPEPARAAASD